AIEVLPGEAQVVFERRDDRAGGSLVSRRCAERIAVPHPYQQVIGVDDRSWRIEVIGFDPEDLDAARRLSFPRRVGAAAAGASVAGSGSRLEDRDRRVIDPQGLFNQGALRAVFAYQVSVVVVDVLGEHGPLLGNALAPYVVGIGGNRDSGLLGLLKPV